jgi:hypothetical protein
MSSQSPVVWWYREVVGMCVEAGPILGVHNILYTRFLIYLKNLDIIAIIIIITEGSLLWKY